MTVRFHIRPIGSLLLTIVAWYGVGFAQVDGDALLGVWYTEKCLAAYEFFRSGDTYSAHLIPLSKPDMVDEKNPVDSLRSRKLSGIVGIHGLVWNARKQRWENGAVYNPQDGRTYSCYCALRNNGTELYFRGFLGVSAIGGSQVWTRDQCGKKG